MKTASILLFVSLGLILASIQGASAQTVAVGNCRTHLVSYPTVSAAVATAAPNSTVLVCPGTYAEQITITTPMTLEGVKDATGAYPIIAVPSGGVSAGNSNQVFVQGDFDQPQQYNISNLVIDGSNSGFDCSSGGNLVGLAYENGDGTLTNLAVRNQSPGGCGIGVYLSGGNFQSNAVTLQNLDIRDFDYEGIVASSSGASGFLVNVNSSWAVSHSPSVQAGIEYSFAQGLVSQNIIVVPSGQTGLQLDNFYPGMTAKGNSIVGGQIGIASGIGFPTTVITHNTVSNNGIGIQISGFTGNALVSWNTINLSSEAAIDLQCGPLDSVKNNTIFNTPIGVANVGGGDKLAQNSFSGVPTLTTVCP